VTFETFARLLVILSLVALVVHIVWRLGQRVGVDGENLLSVLWRDYKYSVGWLLQCRWMLIVLVVAASVEQLSHVLVRTAVWGNTQWASFDLVPPSEWAAHLRSHFVRGLVYTYFLAPLGPVRTVVLPIRGFLWLPVLVLLIGLWLFRSYTARAEIPDELQQGARSFRNTIIWATALAILIVAWTALPIATGEDILGLLTPVVPWAGVGFWIRYPPSLLATSGCGALFMSALLGTYRAHLDSSRHAKVSHEAFRHYRHMFLFIVCVMPVMFLLGAVQYLIGRTEVFETGIERAFLQYVSIGLMNAVYLAFLLVPAAIVADNVPLRAAVKRSLSAWDTQLIQMVIAVVFFMAVAFVVQTALFVATLPFLYSGAMIGLIRQYVVMLLQTSIVVGVYRFYLRLSAYSKSWGMCAVKV